MPRLPSRCRQKPWLPSRQQQPCQQRVSQPVLWSLEPPLLLLLVLDEDLVPENYSYVDNVVWPLIYQAMEGHMSPALLSASHADKLAYRRTILYKCTVQVFLTVQFLM